MGTDIDGGDAIAVEQAFPPGWPVVRGQVVRCGGRYNTTGQGA